MKYSTITLLACVLASAMVSAAPSAGYSNNDHGNNDKNPKYGHKDVAPADEVKPAMPTYGKKKEDVKAATDEKHPGYGVPVATSTCAEVKPTPLYGKPVDGVQDASAVQTPTPTPTPTPPCDENGVPHESGNPEATSEAVAAATGNAYQPPQAQGVKASSAKNVASLAIAGVLAFASLAL